MNTFVRLLITSFLALSIADAHASDLIVNGSFESPSNPPMTIDNISPGSTTLSGWTVSGNAIALLTNGCCDPAVAALGSQFVDLTGPNDGLGIYGAISQTIATTAGASYQISFEQGNYALNSSAFDGGTTGILVSAGGTSHEFTVGAVGMETGNVWRPFSMSFTAVSNTTSISFLGTAGDAYTGIDNVSVAQVPEPGTYELMTAGLLAVVAAARRRIRV